MPFGSLEKDLLEAERKIEMLETMIQESQHEVFVEKDEHEKMANFTKFNPYPVIRIDNNGKILMSNKAANSYFEIDKMRGLFWNDLVNMNFAKIDTSQGYLQFEYKLNGKDLLLCYRPVPEINAINIYGFDISERKTMERTLEDERARNMHSMKMALLGEMAGGMAHELNTPLGLLQLSLEQLVKSRDNTERFFEITKDMELTIEKMSKLINGFKTFSRSSDSDEFTFTSFQKLFLESMQLCEMSLKNKGIHFSYTQNIADVSIECHPSEISQVIMNLVQNASDAIEKDEDKWIKVEVEHSDELKISVIDSGKGIPDDVVEKMFVPFYTTKDVGKGTGLGLAIIKGIMDKHNGTIGVIKENENTCFQFTLPLIQTVGDFL